MYVKASGAYSGVISLHQGISLQQGISGGHVRSACHGGSVTKRHQRGIGVEVRKGRSVLARRGFTVENHQPAKDVLRKRTAGTLTLLHCKSARAVQMVRGRPWSWRGPAPHSVLRGGRRARRWARRLWPRAGPPGGQTGSAPDEPALAAQRPQALTHWQAGPLASWAASSTMQRPCRL